MSRFDRIAAALAGLTDPAVIRDRLRGFNSRDIVSVLATGGVGGGGGGPVALDDLTDVVATGGFAGYVLTQQGDGSFALESPSAGSSAIEIVRFPVTFDTPGLVAGVVVATLEPGDILQIVGDALYIAPEDAWDGTSPRGHFLFDNRSDPPANPTAGAIRMNTELDATIIPGVVGNPTLFNNGFTRADGVVAGNAALCRGGSVDVLFSVDDGTGGDPGATQGAALIVLEIWRAP